MLGVAAAHATQSSILVTGIAGLVAGAMSMEAREYVSIYSQADTEKAELTRKNAELEAEAEKRELTTIYVTRGLDQTLALQVATQLMAHDALDANARDKLCILDTLSALPTQAALASAASFAVGAVLPVAVATLASANNLPY